MAKPECPHLGGRKDDGHCAEARRSSEAQCPARERVGAWLLGGVVSVPSTLTCFLCAFEADKLKERRPQQASVEQRGRDAPKC